MCDAIFVLIDTYGTIYKVQPLVSIFNNEHIFLRTIVVDREIIYFTWI